MQVILWTLEFTNSTFYWLFTVANQWLVSVMFVVCSPNVELKVFFYLYVRLCVCVCVCACPHVWAWACAWLIIAHVEVRGQPWILDLAFSPFVCHCVLQASWFGVSPCLRLPSCYMRALGLQICAIVSSFPWVLGIQIQGSDTFPIKSFQQALMLLLLT